MRPKIRELARKKERLVGLLAVEILLALYNPGDRGRQHVSVLVFCSPTTAVERLDTRNAHVRANLAGALIRLNPDRHDSADGQGRGVDPGQQILRNLFGLGE